MRLIVLLCPLCLTAALDLSQAKVREVRSVETDGLGLSGRDKHFDLGYCSADSSGCWFEFDVLFVRSTLLVLLSIRFT